MNDLDAVIRALRSAPACTGAAILPPRDRAAIMQMIAHRPPFLLLDQIIAFDAATPSITALRHVAPDDPFFAGHFPGNPIYPGALQLEIIAQAGCCLLAQRGLIGPTLGVPETPPNVVGTRVHHAAFLRPVRPDQTMHVHARLISDDGLLCVIAGQIWVDGLLAAICVLEAHPDAV